MCKGCGVPLHSSNRSGYCSRTEDCRRLSSSVRQAAYRKSSKPRLYVYLNATGNVIYAGEDYTADRDARHARKDSWFLEEVTEIRALIAPENQVERKVMEGRLIHSVYEATGKHPKHNHRCDRPGGCGWRDYVAGTSARVALPSVTWVNSLDELIQSWV